MLLKKRYIFFIIFLFIFSSSFAQEQTTERTVIQSNKMDKDSNNIIKAIGDVEMKKGDQIFNADEVEYNQNTKIIKANSAVRAYDQKDNNIFFAEEAEITDDFVNGDFYNGIMVFKNGSTISSNHIKKIGDDFITQSKSNYAVCPTDIFDEDLTYEQLVKDLEKRKTPLFSLKSTKISTNTEEKVLRLWGTSVWVWKIPIFYIPYFKTGLAFEKEASGFGTPGVENTNHYGYGIYIPYRIKGERQKLVITPKIYQDGNYLANVKYSIDSKTKNKWKFKFNGDIANDNGQSKRLTNAYGISEEDSGDYRQWRGYASIEGFYSFNKLWLFEANAAIASDRYYLRDYYRNNLPYIQSNFKFSRVNMDDIMNFDYFEFSNLFYQELLEENPVQQAPRYAPVTDLNIQNTLFKNDLNNLFYKLKLNTTNLFRTVGIEYNRITFTPSINNTLKTKFGIINTNINLRSDVYILNEVGMKRDEIYNGTESRILPELNIEWRKSFTSKYFTFQPILKYSGSPNSESFEDKIPNEDSKPQILSFENIFSSNRFIGYDREEYGNRISYGFEGMLFNNFTFGIAQGYRDNIDDNINKYIIGFEENVSDYVGYASLVLNDVFNIGYRFLSDRNDFKLKKNEISLNFDLDNINFYIGYTDMEPNILYDRKQKQINTGVQFTFLKKWTIVASGVVDLKNDNRFIDSKIALIYDGGCTRWELRYTNYNPLSQTDRNTSLDFNFTIKFM